ncbi:MAG: UvrD-helicase domain-containing protein [Patescibacteria group bacterium]|uniref:DNA 3'-5' helicase n=1 Tax=candidate division WWE3 bacterium TaxID=2053526 RepID=A0A955ECY3_UNCKA|nr:UvrD-helicase domain-containing protein [candidate division WWE3 bacterium]
MAKIQLSSSQKKAAHFDQGAHLVVAGAGTGKTRVITQRIEYLLKKQSITSNNIVALTFTEKASAEMVERLGDIMPLGYEEPWVYTFHSFADRILKKECMEIGLDPSYKILSGPDQWLLLRKYIFKLDLKYFRPLGNPTKFISAILTFISRLQDEAITPEQFLEFAKKFKSSSTDLDAAVEEKARWEEMAYIYDKYTQLKIQNSKLDFGDLILWTLQLFKTRPNVLAKYKSQFSHMLVDEFQDTNFAQYQLIKMLFSPNDLKDSTTRSLLAVGDDSQSIYKFRGAAISNILDFKDDYPGCEMTTLTENYRSYQEVLDPSYRLVQNNNPDTLESKLGISKELTSMVGSSNVKPKIIRLDTLEDEVEFVVSTILDLIAREPNYTYKDFAIMARANGHLDPFVLALRSYGLPYQLVGNRGLYDRDEVRDLIALLKILIDSHDAISLYRVLNITTLNIDASVISSILSTARYNKTPLWDVFLKNPDPSLDLIKSLIEKYQAQITKDLPSDLLYNFVTDISYIKQFTENESIEGNLSIGNLNLFLEKVKRFQLTFKQETKELPTVVDLIDYLDLIMDAGDNPAQSEIEDIDTINLLTVHASKGLEFPVVFMVNLVSNRFPTRNRRDKFEVPDELLSETLPSGDEHLQEERRLFYVGMTRAEKYLYMLSAKNYGGRRDTTPSGYLEETGIKETEVNMLDLKNALSQLSLFGVESGFKSLTGRPLSNGYEPKFLSYSQMQAFNMCPLNYKYKYILNLPAPPSHALSFGISIHDTLRDFHNALIIGADTSLESLLNMYAQNWQPLGYEDADHRDLRYKEGATLLTNYHADVIKNKPKHLGLEQSFNLTLGGVRFYGKIDRIDVFDDGKESGIEIIDYKTGSPKNQKEVDKDDQITIYAIGAKEALGYDPKKFSMYYLESGEVISTTRTPEQLEEKKKQVSAVVEEMKKGNFEATPGMHCSWCDYKDICPYAEK